jgi:hypothetical protein
MRGERAWKIFSRRRIGHCSRRRAFLCIEKQNAAETIQEIIGSAT